MTDSYAAHQAANDLEANATDRLSRVHGVFELQAALLALILPPGSKRAQRAWEIETAATPGVETLRAHAASLSGAARLPWFERLIERMARQPLAARKEFLLVARRVMGARGIVRPVDRLHWLILRRGFGEVTQSPVRAEASVEVTEWLESDVLALACYTAFLARMVPEESSDGSAGAGWYTNVMSTWQPHEAVLRHEQVDSEEMVEALRRLQTLSWMQRPIVIRSWVAAATKMTGVRLPDLAADAMRMTCQLLDSPLPPELVRHYIVIPPDPAPAGGAAKPEAGRP